MSRSAEEQLLLEQRIEAMKRKNEELRRRHLEVEADKLSAAKQNALVSVNVKHDDDWIPGRHDESVRQDRHQSDNTSSSLSQTHQEERPQWFDNRRSRNDRHARDSANHNHQNEEFKSRSRNNFGSPSGRRNDFQGGYQRSDKERYYGNENRRSGDWSGRPNESSGQNSPRSSQNYSNARSNNAQSASGNLRGFSTTTTFTSKVFRNSSMDVDREKRPTYRLAEGDGPPPDPSYSFLGDAMRDSPEFVDKRRGFGNRRGSPRARGRGGNTWNNRNFHDSSQERFDNQRDSYSKNSGDSKPQTSDDAWRRERSLIDQERINRQKTSDGSWCREWDNNKVVQEDYDRPHQWRRGSHNHSYNRGQSGRGYRDESGKHFSKPQEDDVGSQNSGNATNQLAQDQRYTRRGRFSNQNKPKQYPQFQSVQDQQHEGHSNKEQELSKEPVGSAIFENKMDSDNQIDVSSPSNAPAEQTKRSVKGVGVTLRISVGNEGDSSDGKITEQKRQRRNILKAKRTRIRSTTSTGTTGTAEDDDGSWEDLSSDEDVSVVTELQKAPPLCVPKSVDVSSGPESLDPIPAPGKEDEFLWDDFHPAGFQDNANLDIDAEAAYKALLDEKAKQEVSGNDGQDSLENNFLQSPQVSFKLDASNLETRDDEQGLTKLDPLLVTTQIVQAEVDCMSLTSLPADFSLSEEVNQFPKSKELQSNKVQSGDVGQTDMVDSSIRFDTGHSMGDALSAEELSGPVSILAVSESKVSSGDHEYYSPSSQDDICIDESKVSETESVKQPVVAEKEFLNDNSSNLKDVKEQFPPNSENVKEQCANDKVKSKDSTEIDPQAEDVVASLVQEDKVVEPRQNQKQNIQDLVGSKTDEEIQSGLMKNIELPNSFTLSKNDEGVEEGQDHKGAAMEQMGSEVLEDPLKVKACKDSLLCDEGLAIEERNGQEISVESND